MRNTNRIGFAVLFFLMISTPAAGQDAARVRGDSLRMAGDLAGAVEAYWAGLNRSNDNGALAYQMAGAFALHGQFPDSAFYYLDLALAHEDTMKPLWDADFYFVVDDARWSEVENTQLDKLSHQVSGAFNRDYARQLLRLRLNEWAYRYHIMLAFRQLGPQSPIPTAFARVMQEHHGANLAVLESLIDRYGWPNLSAVGEEAAYAAGNVVNHADLATRQKYLPMLKAVCERGEGDWSRYAHIFDRTELELGKPQVYGTQMERNEETGRYEPQPLLDPAHVDARRAELGMEPLADQLERFNASMKRDFGKAND